MFLLSMPSRLHTVFHRLMLFRSGETTMLLDSSSLFFFVPATKIAFPNLATEVSVILPIQALESTILAIPQLWDSWKMQTESSSLVRESPSETSPTEPATLSLSANICWEMESTLPLKGQIT